MPSADLKGKELKKETKKKHPERLVLMKRCKRSSDYKTVCWMGDK